MFWTQVALALVTLALALMILADVVGIVGLVLMAPSWAF
jgi:hypothetical protein